MRQATSKTNFICPNQFKASCNVQTNQGDILVITNDVNDYRQQVIGYELLNKNKGEHIYLSVEDFGRLTNGIIQ